LICPAFFPFFSTSESLPFYCLLPRRVLFPRAFSALVRNSLPKCSGTARTSPSGLTTTYSSENFTPLCFPILIPGTRPSGRIARVQTPPDAFCRNVPYKIFPSSFRFSSPPPPPPTPTTPTFSTIVRSRILNLSIFFPHSPPATYPSLCAELSL